VKGIPNQPSGGLFMRFGLIALLMVTHASLQANSPPRCAGYGTLQSFSLTDWESGPGDWTAETHSIANPVSFDTPDWAVVNNLPDQQAGKAAFVANLNTGNCEDDDKSGALTLDSPPIFIPEDVMVPRISINHWFAVEVLFDGGNMKLSVNGGEFQLIPASAFEARPYPAVLNDALWPNTNPLASEPAFTGPDGVAGSWGASHINLLGLAEAGDTVTLRFDYGVDLCEGVTGWYVDEVEFYSCSAELLPSLCGNSVLDGDESCDDGNDFIGDGCSNLCEVESGWECTDLLPPANIQDPGFEAGSPNPVWTETYSIGPLPPICNLDDCGNGFGSGPSEGDYWVWLGGTVEPDEASVSQSVTIPSTSSDLLFDFEVPLCAGQADYFEVLIDNNREFYIDGTDARCDVRGYSTEIVDVAAYADDSSHMITFHAEVTGANGEVSNFFVDFVRIPGTPSICTAIGDLLFSDGFE
jgi:cysteine-rich repeat protein